MNRRLLLLVFVLIATLSLSLSVTAQDFDWRAHEGESLKLLLNQHPYQQALVGELAKFTELTGIEVTYDVFPEQNYFDKVTIDLSAGDASTYDVFMTGAYMIWQYAPAGWMEPLEPYINDPAKTNPDYDFEDIFADLRNSEMWNLEPGRDNLGAVRSTRSPGVLRPTLSCIAKTCSTSTV
jgi:multiple sugar transport system substrate-binding protein